MNRSENESRRDDSKLDIKEGISVNQEKGRKKLGSSQRHQAHIYYTTLVMPGACCKNYFIRSRIVNGLLNNAKNEF